MFKLHITKPCFAINRRKLKHVGYQFLEAC